MRSIVSPDRINLVINLLRYPSDNLIVLPKFIFALYALIARKIARLPVIKQLRQLHKSSRLKNISAPEFDKSLFNESVLTFNKEPSVQDDFDSVKLAGICISATADLDWDQERSDIEDVFALNRFGWLLVAISETPSAQLSERSLKWIMSWIKSMGDRLDHPAWESYSVAERLSNWPFILQIAKNHISLTPSFVSEVESSMRTHISHLLNNLEDRGVFTNNHILNDAKGLYIGGSFLRDKVAVHRAEDLFHTWTERIFHCDGMISEHSSHYQYLMCQRYEQVYFMSLYSDNPAFTDFMSDWSGRIRNACNMFEIGNDQNTEQALPLIGDISPDFPPNWVAPCQDSGWSRFKESFGWKTPHFYEKELITPFKSSMGGFFRYDIGDVVILWHVDVDGMTHIGHGHYDIGSFLIYYQGKQIIGDPGRFSYSVEGSYGRGASSHSTIMIDGLGAYCEDLRLNTLSGFHRFQQANIYFAEEDEGFHFEIKCDGFMRLRTPVSWKRKFIVGKRKIMIIDDLKSAGTNKVETLFQIGPGVELIKESNAFSLKSPGCQVMNFEPVSTMEPTIKESSFSTEYGYRVSGTTIKFSNTLTGSQTYTYRIRW